MPEFTVYKGYRILNVAPTGDGGVVLNDNFILLGDLHEACVNHFSATTAVHGSTSINVPNAIVQRDINGGILIGSLHAAIVSATNIFAQSISSNISVQMIEISEAGTVVGTRKGINFSGSGIVSVTDDATNDRVNIQVASESNTYSFVQSTPQTVWNISHGLERFPDVTVVDSTGALVIPDIKYLDENNIQITSDVEFSGAAYLN